MKGYIGCEEVRFRIFGRNRLTVEELRLPTKEKTKKEKVTQESLCQL